MKADRFPAHESHSNASAIARRRAVPPQGLAPQDIEFFYYSHASLQVPRVARQCMVSFCDALSQLGVQTELVSFSIEMSPHEPLHPQFRELYGVEGNLSQVTYKLPVGRIAAYGAIGTLLLSMQRAALYLGHTVRSLWGGNPRPAGIKVFCARNYSVLAILVIVVRLLRRGRKAIVLADVHGLPGSGFGRLVHRIVDGNVCISRALAADLSRVAGVPEERLCVAHSGVKISRFAASSESKKDLRIRLGLPVDKKIVCYLGKVYYPYEEVSYYLDVAGLLDDESLVLVVGGRPDQVAKWEESSRRRSVNRIRFRSFVAPAHVPEFMQAADLLVMYYSPSPLNDYRSPGKLFEYLASGTPVVAGRFRSTCEVIVEGQNGFLVEPYQPLSLAHKINEVIGNQDLLREIGLHGRATAREYTWEARSRRVRDFAVRLVAG